MSTTDHPERTPFWGYLSLIIGAASLIVAVLVVFAGPFAPQPSVGTTIGETAGDMLAAARRSVEGVAQPTPEPRGLDIDRVLITLTPILGVVAVLLAMGAAIRREGWRLSAYGSTLGAAAIVFPFLWWVALLICGVLLLVAIIENLGSFVEGFGG